MNKLYLFVLILIFFIPSCIVDEDPEVTTTTFFLYKMDGTPGTGKLFINGEEKGSGTESITIDKLIPDTEYTIRCKMEGTHDQWLIIRHELQGQNKVQKDTENTEAIYKHISINSDSDIYLIKIPNEWDINTYKKYLDPDNNGMINIGSPIVRVTLRKDYINGAQAEAVVNTLVDEFNKAQITGDFSEPRKKYSIVTTNNGEINIIFLNIKTSGSHIGYGQNLNESIVFANIQLPGSDKYTDTNNTLRYWFFGHLAVDPIKLINQRQLINFTTDPIEKSKFELTDYMKRLVLINSQFDTGVRF